MLTMREAILERWQARREEWERFDVQVSGRAVATQVLSDIESLLSANDREALTLKSAAEESNYSVDHLSRLIRTGKLRNIGKKGSPRIPRGELPFRSKRVAAGESVAYDARADAQSLRVRR